MAETTKIEWTDSTWNPITGCSVVSPGCTNCYAMRLAGTRMKHHWSRKGLTEPSKAGPVWNGKVRFNEEWLDQPMRWRRPRPIFVCAHGDLFHENVPDEWIDQVFAVMALAPQHIFQVLTKRPDRMQGYLTDRDRSHAIGGAVLDLDPHRVLLRGALPLPNVWLGVSIENRQLGQERAWELANTPAAVRWWSVEPLLEDLGDLTQLCLFDTIGNGQKAVDWVVIGGESGPNARPFDLEWARSIIAQCRQAGVPCFVKQVGSNPNTEFKLLDPKGGDWDEWPEDLQVREYPEIAT